MKNTPLVSVIIVNHNGLKWLKDCLDSIIKQSYKNTEIIFVDNNSHDDSVDFVKKNYKKVRLIVLKENIGFAGGNNEAFKVAKGDYYLLINNDTKVGKNYIKNFLKAFDDIPNLFIAQSKIVHMDDKDKIDTCGSFLTSTSFLYHFGNGKKASLKKYNKPFPVFSVKAASILIRASILEKTGGFDETFWSYYEETDLCHRGWVMGYESWYWPEAVCLHAGGGTSLVHFHYSEIQFHNFKNKLRSILKNFETKSLALFLPIFTALNLLLSFAWLIQGKYKHSLSLYRAYFWNLNNLSNTLKERSRISKLRVNTDNNLFDNLLINPRSIYYKHLFFDDIKNYKD